MLNNPKSGPQAAFEFQISGLPWVTSSIAPTSPGMHIDFPTVTKCFTIKALTGSLSFGFTQNGVLSGNRFILAQGDIATFDIRTTSLYLLGETGSATFSLIAGLTMIQREMMPVLTGSLWDGVG
jgi:hypothetical protein